jgi:hypothetical protein
MSQNTWISQSHLSKECRPRMYPAQILESSLRTSNPGVKLLDKCLNCPNYLYRNEPKTTLKLHSSHNITLRIAQVSHCHRCWGQILQSNPRVTRLRSSLTAKGLHRTSERAYSGRGHLIPRTKNREHIPSESSGCY